GDYPMVGGDMTGVLSGADVLALIDRELESARGGLDEVAGRLERSTTELERLHQSELGVLGVLARVRLHEIERGELLEALDDTAKRVTSLLADRAKAQESAEAELTAAQAVLAKLEQERTAQHAAADTAEQAVDAAAAEAQQHLSADAAYCAQLEKAHASDATADLAEAKAQAAHTDRTEKGKPYEADSLFIYLWARGYGTSTYRGAPITRLIDGWVARVDGYDPLRKNYWMLTELPARFDEHARQMRSLADSDVAAVQALERTAAEKSGVPERRAAFEAAEQALAELDRKIEAQNETVRALVAKRASFAAGEDDISRSCIQLLGDTFRGEQMRTLRARATRTATPEDDAAVDQLTAIRADLPRIEDEAARYRKLHDAQVERATKLEDLRKRFKQHRFDAVSSEFVNGALIGALLGQLAAGTLAVPDIWDSLRRQQRYRVLAADPRFGSGRFPRFPGSGPWRGGGGWGGGFGGGGFGGGGFGGGGFGTGGGFGGGGFKTGGGF
ncbi:MAG TPA: hypothetical protein VFY39_14055, partial [Gammaproteobacteria bacterium]|nr:hypothetical protein [Gammaproteobacteria bacterium]